MSLRVQIIDALFQSNECTVALIHNIWEHLQDSLACFAMTNPDHCLRVDCWRVPCYMRLRLLIILFLFLSLAILFLSAILFHDCISLSFTTHIKTGVTLFGWQLRLNGSRFSESCFGSWLFLTRLLPLPKGVLPQRGPSPQGSFRIG